MIRLPDKRRKSDFEYGKEFVAETLAEMGWNVTEEMYTNPPTRQTLSAAKTGVVKGHATLQVHYDPLSLRVTLATNLRTSTAFTQRDIILHHSTLCGPKGPIMHQLLSAERDVTGAQSGESEIVLKNNYFRYDFENDSIQYSSRTEETGLKEITARVLDPIVRSEYIVSSQDAEDLW